MKKIIIKWALKCIRKQLHSKSYAGLDKYGIEDILDGKKNPVVVTLMPSDIAIIIKK